MSGLVQRIDLSKLYFLTGNLVTTIIPAGATQVIDYKSQFNGIAKSVLIDNRDAVNEMTYRVHGTSTDLTNVRISSSRVLTIPIEWLQIIAGAAGVVQVTAEVVPLSALGL